MADYTIVPGLQFDEYCGDADVALRSLLAWVAEGVSIPASVAKARARDLRDAGHALLDLILQEEQRQQDEELARYRAMETREEQP